MSRTRLLRQACRCVLSA